MITYHWHSECCFTYFFVYSFWRALSLNLCSKSLENSAAVMAFMLHQIMRNPSPRLVSDHSKVGKKAGDARDGNFDEYDFVIVGGGNIVSFLCSLTILKFHRYCWLCFSYSVNWGPLGSRVTSWSWPKVRLRKLSVYIDLIVFSGNCLLFSRIPIAFSLLFHSKHVYQVYTEPQLDAKNQRKFWPRAKMLGGCEYQLLLEDHLRVSVRFINQRNDVRRIVGSCSSSISYPNRAQYGAPQDYDEWGKIINDESWSWNNLSKWAASIGLADWFYNLSDTSTNLKSMKMMLGIQVWTAASKAKAPSVWVTSTTFRT